MDIVIEHTSKPLILCWPYLLGGNKPCLKVNTFCYRVKKVAKLIAATPPGQPNVYFWPPPSGKWRNEDLANTFIGDAFEILGEALIRFCPDMLGIYDYHPTPPNEPGVDGSGISAEGKPVTVQFKFRAWDRVLTKDKEHLDNFGCVSWYKYKVREPGNMVLVTTGRETFWKNLDQSFLSSVRCLGRNSSYGFVKGMAKKTIHKYLSLRTLLDNKNVFWDAIRRGVGLP